MFWLHFRGAVMPSILFTVFGHIQFPFAKNQGQEASNVAQHTNLQVQSHTAKAMVIKLPGHPWFYTNTWNHVPVWWVRRTDLIYNTHLFYGQTSYSGKCMEKVCGKFSLPDSIFSLIHLYSSVIHFPSAESFKAASSNAGWKKSMHSHCFVCNKAHFVFSGLNNR